MAASAAVRLPVILQFIIFVNSAAAQTPQGGSKQCDAGYFRISKEADCQKCGACASASSRLKPVTCNPGGGLCDTNQCAPDKFGERCLDDCGKCIGGALYCDQTNGTCKLGCEQGYGGELCKLTCAEGTFGENCTQKCGKCYGGAAMCDKEVGVCTQGCEVGWTGLFCRVRCPDGRYGVNCQQQCGNCKHMHMCDKVTGSCAGGCKAGYQGDTCTERCPRGKYGPNCIQTCKNCRRDCTCDRFTGVCDQACQGDKQGKTVRLVNRDLKSGVVDNHSAMKVVTPAIVVSVVALVTGLGAIAGIIYYNRRKKLQPTNSKQKLKTADAEDTYENVSTVYKRKSSTE